MTRRELLAAAGAACALPLQARTHWDKSRISAITDEIGNTTEESIAFAHQYGLRNVEIRDRHTAESRKEYFTLTEAEIKADAIRFSKEGLKVSFINTSLMKFTWPGMEPPRRRPEDAAAREKRLASEKARFDNRMEDLEKAIHCAQWMGCDKVRVFTGTRLAEPRNAFQQVADVLGPTSIVTAAKLSPEPGIPKASTKSPFATEAIVVLPLWLRNSVPEPVLTVSVAPLKLVIVIAVPETAVTWPATEGKRTSMVVASIWKWSEDSVPVTETSAPATTAEDVEVCPASS